MKIGCQIFFVFLCLQPTLIFAQNCPPNEHWVRAHFRKAYYRADGTFVKATSVTAHCRTNPIGFAYWQPKLKEGRPEGWPNSKEKIKKWTEDEKERVVEALSELPESLWGKSIEGIYRMEKSQDLSANTASSMDKIIVLYDEAFSKKNKLARSLAHELAHQKYMDLPKAERIDYHFVTNWIVSVDASGSRRIHLSRKDNFIEEDGLKSPDEDFANNVEAYLFDSARLKSVTPHAYRWIEQHFGDRFKIIKAK